MRLSINGKICLAPLSGITDYPFCKMVTDLEGEIIFAEMISARALVEKHPKTTKMLNWHNKLPNIITQLFGGEAEIMAAAAERAQDLGVKHIDINAGCPVKKVLKSGAGASLLKDVDRLKQILTIVRKRITIPLSLKIRLGWDRKQLVAAEICKLAADCGLEWVTIHTRTAVENYQTPADWETLAKIVETSPLPIIGNGDIYNGQDAERMFKNTGCAAVMLGRGAMGKPWIFKYIRHYLNKQEILPEPTWEQKLAWGANHLDLAIAQYGERSGLLKMRKHLAWYINKMPKAKTLRNKINQADNLAELKLILEEALIPP